MEAALKIGWEFLQLMSICLPILYTLYIYRSAQMSMGHTVLPLCSGFAELVMRIGSALLLPAVIGYYGLFWAEVLAWTGAVCVLIPGYYWALARHRREDKTANA